MKIETKFEIGEKFRITDEYLECMNVSKDQIFRIDAIKIEPEGIYYYYYKFPANKNRKYNDIHRGKSACAEFIMEKVK